MSEFRIEKRKVPAELTLSTGAVVDGCLFLAGSNSARSGPERVADLLNAEPGFFPFELANPGPDGLTTALYNRAHLVRVRLREDTDEVQLDSGYKTATKKHVTILLSSGETITGSVRVYRPPGRDRLSDYTRSSEVFRYIESTDATYVVNGAFVVELRETTQ